MRYSDIPGHSLQKSILNQQIVTGHIPHAQIFYGQGGSAQLALAHAFANQLLCENLNDDGACGECKACHKSAKLIHPDLHFSFPVVGSKKTSAIFLSEWRDQIMRNPYCDIRDWLALLGDENKHPNINKDECTDIQHKLSLKPFESARKILLMWLPEYLGREGNRLLKLIEEPPENTILIFVSNDISSILGTILSRCSLLHIPPVPKNQIVEHLDKVTSLDEKQKEQVARISQGNLNTALDLSQGKVNDMKPLFLDWLRTCYRNDSFELFEKMNELSRFGREQHKQFILYALVFLTDMLHMDAGMDSSDFAEDEKKSIRGLMTLLPRNEILFLIEQFELQFSLIERNANQKIQWMAFSLQVRNVLRGRNPAEFSLKILETL